MNKAQQAADRAWRENKGLRDTIRHLQGGGDDDNDDGDMSDLVSRVTRLEYGLVAAFLILAGAIGGLYLYVDGQVDPLKSTVSRLDERTIAMQKQMDDMDEKLDKLLAK